MRTLRRSARRRLHCAFVPATDKAYASMFRLFIAFTVFLNTTINQVNADFLLLYLEFLVYNGASPSQVANHLSALKAKFIIFSLDSPMFDDPRLSYFIRSLKLNAPLRVTLHNIIDIKLLTSIIRQCDKFYMGQIFKAMYLLAFFSFLRLSNMCPHSKNSFSPLKHLTPQDIFFKQDSAIVLIKWSKTLQFNNQVKLLHIPVLNNHLCPVTAIRNVMALSPQGSNVPLFQYKTHLGWAPVTDNQVRANLRNILLSLNLSSSHVTFHSFRRSGATFAFNNNVPLQAIKHQGTWTSDCVWKYIVDSADAGSKVAETFHWDVFSYFIQILI